MNVLMYPLGTEDDFPDEFCAIRQGSGEHWFYTPVGEDASWMLFRALADNAKLREELADAPKCETCEAMLDCDECLRADGSHKERRRLSAENAKLRELVRWPSGWLRVRIWRAVQRMHVGRPW